MEIVFTVLILLLTVALSGALTRVLPLRLPLPLMQIAFGAMLAWPRLNLHVTFDPEIFMLLFIPPLLFADGWRIEARAVHAAPRDPDARVRARVHDAYSPSGISRTG
jgi:CPA1 family monovalent cation:H+ antiporter